MTWSVPAGAGGVDRDALVLRRAFAADRSDDMAKLYVQDVGDLLAALAAAEQRADTLAVENAEADLLGNELGEQIIVVITMDDVTIKACGHGHIQMRYPLTGVGLAKWVKWGQEALHRHPDLPIYMPGYEAFGCTPQCERGHHFGDRDGCQVIPFDLRDDAALSSRPVQPEGKQR